MICPYCHYPDNKPNARFCENCGAMLPPPGKKKRYGGLIAVITILIVAAIGGITAILLLNPGEKNLSVPTSGQTSSAGNQEITETAAVSSALPETAAAAETSTVEIQEPALLETAFSETEENLPLSCTVSTTMPAGLPNTLQVPAASAYASSTISQSGYDNSALCVIDGRDETSWQEGTDGTGIGEFLTIEYEEKAQVQFFVFKLGNWRDNDYFYGNNRPKTLILSFDDGSSVTASFPSDKAVYYAELSSPATTSSVTVTIDDVYQGTSWDDTCIAEITAYAAPY